MNVKEIRMSRHKDSFVVSILYSQIDDSGNEFDSKWSDPIKGDNLPPGIAPFLEGVFTRISSRIRQIESL